MTANAARVSRGRSMDRRPSESRGLMESASVFAALGDATRLQIVMRLCDDGPLSIARLTEGSRVSRQAVSKHLRALEEAGLVNSDRNGRERIWELETKQLAEARRHLDEISRQWDQAVERLRAFVERNRS
jgi:DNA-binding transcriptional ArsR family regulator